MQEWGRVRDKQEKSYRMQSLPLKKMSPRRHVQVWFTIRPQIQLVQNPLSFTATTATANRTTTATAAATSLHAGYSRSAATTASALATADELSYSR